MSEEKKNSEEKTENNPSLQNDQIADSEDQITNENVSQQALGEAQPQQIINQNTVDLTLNEKSSKPKILQPITDMEAHHHSNVHHSKKWKDYLFEFLMLFLAITAGFFVENKRESYIEHERAKQFSKQLIADLRLDSALFEDRRKTIQSLQKGYDSLQYLLTQKNDATDKEVLKILLPITFAFDVPATASTYNQMKTSGSLRYIENIDLTAHLQHYYDVLLPRCIRIAEASLTYFSDHISPFYLKHIRIQDFDPFNDSLINNNPLLINRSKETDQELANIMGSYRSLLTIQTITMNEPALKKIKETIPILKKEYDLE